MKNISLLILLCICFSACKKDQALTDFEKSYNTWLSFKNMYNNSYTYMVSYGSWTGYGTETVLKITNGVVVARSFKSYRRVTVPPATTPTNEIIKSWTEAGATVNTHDKNDGAAGALTLDEVYEKARNIWLKADKDENDIYFEAANNGLISSCGFVPKNCQDDCFSGISITSIKAE